VRGVNLGDACNDACKARHRSLTKVDEQTELFYGFWFRIARFRVSFFPSQVNVMTVVSAACAQADMNTKTAIHVGQRQSRTSVSTDSLAIELGFGHGSYSRAPMPAPRRSAS
jgi:hypothetical protein